MFCTKTVTFQNLHCLHPLFCEIEEQQKFYHFVFLLFLFSLLLVGIRGVQKYAYTAVFLWLGTHRGTLACTAVVW